ncbi:MAG: PKD domain-containing protein [Armatimonadota bacterium]
MPGRRVLQCAAAKTLGLILAVTATLSCAAWSEVLVAEDFEDGDLAARGWYDIAKWGPDRSLSIAGEPEVAASTGKRCLKIRYAEKDTGGWMHIDFPDVPEVYVRYYRLFPEGWEWPKGYGPHDSIVFAGSYGVPTDTDLSVYLDFWKSADTYVRVATARQTWGYGGYAQVLRKHGGVANRLPFNVAAPDKVQPGKWHCVEHYARLSDPGKKNGHLKLWVNGKLVSDLAGLPLVDENHAGIRFNHWMLGPYFHGGSHREQSNYLDSLVIATEYVGTLQQRGNQPPRAHFSHTREWGSMTAAFDAARSADPDGEIARFSWDFGDGESGEGRTVSHTYARDGQYTVALTVADGKGETHAFRRTISVGRGIGSGAGLKAEYFDGEQLEGEPTILVARQIAFRRQGWAGRFLCSHVGDNQGDNYSCRWTGFVQPTRSEEYTLTFEVNDGGRVWFDGELVIDAWDRPQTKSAPVGPLVAGRKYPIRVEHHKGTFDATRDWKALLYWESPSVERELIPATQFYPPEGFAEPL